MGNYNSSQIVKEKRNNNNTKIIEKSNQILLSERRLSSTNNQLPLIKNNLKLNKKQQLSSKQFVNSELNNSSSSPSFFNEQQQQQQNLNSKYEKRKQLALTSPQPFIKHYTSPNLSRSRRMSLAAVLYEKNCQTNEQNLNIRRHSRAVIVGGSVPRKLSYNNDDINYSINSKNECSLAEHLKLTCYQLQILQQSWPKIKLQGSLSNVFKEFTFNNNSVREMFQKMSIVEGFLSGKCFDQKEHFYALTELIDFIIQNLNSPLRCIQQKCQQIGVQHFIVFGESLNKVKLWDDFGECLSNSFAKSEQIRGKREAFKAWITLTNFLVEYIRIGYLQQTKKRSLASNSLYIPQTSN